MRIFLLVATVAIVTLASTGPSRAYDGPWCLRGERGGGQVVDDCQYASFPACRHFLTLYGPTASCIPNANFRYYVIYQPRKKRKF